MKDADFSAKTFWTLFCAAQKQNGQEASDSLRDKIHVYPSIGSTNTQALSELSKCKSEEQCHALHKEIFIAAEQTKGRGRQGRTFYSPTNTGIYFSFIYAPGKTITEPALLTVSAAVGVCRAIDSCFDEHCKIKWVNDIYLRQKKVCGILTEGWTGLESGLIKAAVIGIGINISLKSSQANEAFLGNAGGIVNGGETDTDKRLLLASKAISEIFSILDNGQNVMDEYRERSILTGKTVTVTPLAGAIDGIQSHPYEAKVVRIEDDAGLTVRLADGSTLTLNSGEVSLHESLLF